MQVTYLSIRNWQDSTEEKKQRAAYGKASQDRCSTILHNAVFQSAPLNSVGVQVLHALD